MINLCLKFTSVNFKLLQEDDLISDPKCGLGLESGNLTYVHDTPSHYALSFSEVSLN